MFLLYCVCVGTVELWKALFRYLYSIVQFKKRATHSRDKEKADGESQRAEVVHHHDEPSQANGMVREL